MKSNDPVCLELVCKRRPIRNTGIIRCAINLRPNVCKNGHLLATPPLCNLTKNDELFAASLSDSRAYLELIEPRIFFFYKLILRHRSLSHSQASLILRLSSFVTEM